MLCRMRVRARQLDPQEEHEVGAALGCNSPGVVNFFLEPVRFPRCEEASEL